MSNIIEYAETALSPMTETPFTHVDSLVLSQFAYIHIDGLVPGLADGKAAVRFGDLLRAEHFSTMFTDILAPENNKQLLYALCASPRFRDVTLNWYTDTHDAQRLEQFGAMTFLLPDGTAYLAYRGTDTTFLGWKEDFNMAYVCPVPSQASGLAYLEQIAALCDRPLRLGGHSKGGNVAVYAAMKCSDAVRSRILHIYSHDGPGFNHAVIDGTEFSAIEARIDKTLPQSSTVGMLLQSHEPYKVVKSNQLGGLLQHDPFSWVIEDNAFVTLDKITGSAAYMNTTLDKWLEQLPNEKRAVLIGAMFEILDASGAKTFADFSEHWQTDIPAMLKALSRQDAETREEVLDIFKALAVISFKGLLPELPAIPAKAVRNAHGKQSAAHASAKKAKG